MATNYDENYRLTHQQQRFCDLYLTHFNAFKAAVESGYSENTSRKGALLHVPKIQRYLKERMAARSQRLEITHDMILRELSKIAFSNMGNYYDEYACLKRMNELTVDEKAAISFYDITEVQDGEGYRVGMQSRIKLHNKMSALDKIARHLNFYGVLGPKAESEKPKAYVEQEGDGSESRMSGSREEGKKSESWEHGADDTPLTPLERGTIMATVRSCAVVDRSEANLPMDYPEEDFELEGIDLKTLMALEEVNVSPGAPDLMIEGVEDEVKGERQMAKGFLKADDDAGRVENFLTISPLGKKGREVGKQGKTGSKKHLSAFRTEIALGPKDSLRRMGADTGS